MAQSKIQNFSVKKLFGRYDLSLDIKDSRLILVGPNGIGKSTVINMFYYFVSRQWSRLSAYQFEEVSITVTGRTVSISKAEMQSFHDFTESLDEMPIRYRKMIDFLQSRGELESFISRQRLTNADLSLFAELTGFDQDDVYRFHRNLSRRFLTEGDLFSHRAREARDFLEREITERILYLPTYRRIEQGLDVVFPGLEREVRRYTDREIASGRQTKSYVEIVRFGMEDVAATIKKTLDGLKENARSQFNALAGSYLRDVIRGDADKFEREIIAALSDEDIYDILSRVEEQMLSDNDKQVLLSVIKTIKNEEMDLREKDKFLAHYFSKLVSVSQTLKKADVSVRKFEEVCNKYLKPYKSLTYNDKSYTISAKTEHGSDIELREMSSGEKQIVSLFSHVLLDTDTKYIVIIDEPELSLSMPWQKTFLPDIMSLPQTNMLLAVTHSPFIYQNELRKNTFDVRKFIRSGGA